MKPTLLILAAGMGSRYGGLKQLDAFGPNGESLMDYSVYDAVRAGFGKIVFVIRKGFAKEFEEQVTSRFSDRVPVEVAFQELEMLPEGTNMLDGREKPWGTGHAIWTAREWLREPFAMINADDFYGPRSFKLASEFLMSGTAGDPARYAMVGFILRNTLTPYGACSRGIAEVNGTGLMKHVTEHKKIELRGEQAVSIDDEGNERPLTGDEVTSMNLWCFDPSIVPHLERLFRDFLGSIKRPLKDEFYIPSAVDRLIVEGNATVKVLPSPEVWFGVTYHEDKETTQRSIRERIAAGEYPEKLWG